MGWKFAAIVGDLLVWVLQGSFWGWIRWNSSLCFAATSNFRGTCLLCVHLCTISPESAQSSYIIFIYLSTSIFIGRAQIAQLVNELSNLKIYTGQFYCWSDSSVQQAKDTLWKYVPTSLNPADMLPTAASPHDVLNSSLSWYSPQSTAGLRCYEFLYTYTNLSTG